MALTESLPITGLDRLAAIESAVKGDGLICLDYTNAVYIKTGSGAPTSGAAGTGAGVTGPGSLYIDYTTPVIYQNTNTKASPTWTAVSSES